MVGEGYIKNAEDRIAELEEQLADAKAGSAKAEALKARLEKAEETLAALEKKAETKKEPDGSDEDVCKECGGDLYETDEEGVVKCPRCNIYYEVQ